MPRNPKIKSTKLDSKSIFIPPSSKSQLDRMFLISYLGEAKLMPSGQQHNQLSRKEHKMSSSIQAPSQIHSSQTFSSLLKKTGR